MAEPSHHDRPWLDPDADAFIHVQGVTKKFGSFIAVNNVDIKIYRGELFALLGGSGCGKTTLLRVLAGFEQPTEGRVVIDGVDMTDLPSYERPTNMMFQSYALFPHMNVENNVAYGLKRDGVPKPEIAERVSAMLELVQLTPFAKRKPHQLSGGQRQRVALARSLIKQPKVLLLDEPLGALDKKLREQTQFELMNIQDQLGITFIVVTHDQEEAMTLSTRIAVMNEGEIAQVGEPTEIYEKPQTRFTADFIGTVNLFEGRVEESAAGPVVRCEDVPQPLHVEANGDLKAGADVCVAIRPEKIALSKDAPPDNGANQMHGQVQDLAYMGNLSIYRVKLDGGRIVQITTPNQRRLSERDINWDDDVTVSWQPADAIVLTQ
ncbi:MAG: ABC transporter ATP-binding protein [Gammaproteobacteria bacterium]